MNQKVSAVYQFKKKKRPSSTHLYKNVEYFTQFDDFCLLFCICIYLCLLKYKNNKFLSDLNRIIFEIEFQTNIFYFYTNLINERYKE